MVAVLAVDLLTLRLIPFRIATAAAAASIVGVVPDHSSLHTVGRTVQEIFRCRGGSSSGRPPLLPLYYVPRLDPDQPKIHGVIECRAGSMDGSVPQGRSNIVVEGRLHHGVVG